MKNFSLAMLSFLFSTTLFAQNQFNSLFNGKDLKGWTSRAGGAVFSVENNTIVGTTVANSGNTFLVTDKEYGDFRLIADVMVEDPEGNSGLQVRSHFDPTGNGAKGLVYGKQCEIDPSPRKWSGGIYDEGRRQWLYPMQLNANAQNAFKQGGFNHYEIECIGNEMKTWVNGIPCAYVVDTIDRSGFIALQVHAVSPQHAGKKVYFKNIKIQTIDITAKPFPSGIYVANFEPNDLTAYEKRDSWKLLFDGISSKGWFSARGTSFPKRGWDISHGVISVKPDAGKEAQNGGDIVTSEQFSAFDLSFEFKLTPGANSGVKYFVTLAEQTSGSAIGLEYQVLDDSLHPDAKLGRDGDRTLASLYDLIKAEKQKRFLRPIGQWNFGRIVVYSNNKVEHYLNGVKVLEYVRGSKEFKDLVAMSKYHVWPNFGEAPKGHILLQDHGDAVSFRSIKIKSFKN